MKTIEERAKEYADEILKQALLMYDKDASDFLAENAYHAYLAGAKEALAGQWRDAEKEKPEDGEEILMAKLIIPPASRALRTPLIGYIADKFRSEYEHGGFGYSEVTHWLPIPELPTLKPTEK